MLWLDLALILHLLTLPSPILAHITIAAVAWAIARTYPGLEPGCDRAPDPGPDPDCQAKRVVNLLLSLQEVTQT